MKKTIILNENAFNKIKNLIIKEAITSGPTFGNPGKKGYVDYTPYLKSIEKIANLRVDRYKDYELEAAYNDWENSGFDKNSDEYFIYKTKFKNFMCKFINNLSYTSQRLNGPLHSLILDPQWIPSLNGNPNWRYSDANSGQGGDEWHCFYTTILKIYQNPCIWNDFFFNPNFKQYAFMFFSVRGKLMDKLAENIEEYKNTYSKILPTKEYAELNKYVGKIVKVVDEATKEIKDWEIVNRQNEKQDLFVDFNPSECSVDNEDSEDDF